MSQRFEGALTYAEDENPDSSIVPTPERPPRPVLVELAAAILIVGGLTALVGWVGSQLALPSLPTDAGIVTAIVVGLNVVAIAIFLYLTAFPNAIAVTFLVLDMIVFVALIRHRAWFEWKPPTDPVAA
jgi:hypothetical protein